MLARSTGNQGDPYMVGGLYSKIPTRISINFKIRGKCRALRSFAPESARHDWARVYAATSAISKSGLCATGNAMACELMREKCVACTFLAKPQSILAIPGQERLNDRDANGGDRQSTA
jgi:hypothetical protein